MARIKAVDYPMDFKSLEFESQLDGERNDCAVKAVAIVCGVSYREAKERLDIFGRRKRCGTHRYSTHQAIESFGFTIRRWSAKERLDLIKTYPGPHDRLQSITSHHPRRFPKAWEPMAKKTLLLFSRSHVLAFKDGEVKDWSINRALRIGEVWEVTRI